MSWGVIVLTARLSGFEGPAGWWIIFNAAELLLEMIF